MGTGLQACSRGLLRFAAPLIVAVAALACAPAAFAVDAPAPVQRVVGKGAEVTADGLYRVNPSVGEPLLTHGPDARAATERPAGTGLAADGTGFQAGAVERRPQCATDFYEQVIYAYVSGTPDRAAEATPEIRS